MKIVQVRPINKSARNLLSVKSRAVKLRTAVIVLMTLIATSVTVPPGQASLEYAGPVTLPPLNRVQSKSPSKPAVKPAQQSASTNLAKDGEYLPTSWYTKSGTRSNSSGQKYIGLNRWQQTDVSLHSLKWESDAVNTTNGFWVFQYKLSNETKEVILDLRGLRIDFGKEGGSGGGLVLAVYEGSPPASLFAGQQPGFGTPKLRRDFLEKPAKGLTRVIEQLSDTIRFSSAVKEFSIVLIGMDPWSNSMVTIHIDSLRALSRPAKSMKK